MNWSLFHARLHTTFKQRQLLRKASRILVAVSGGQDSLCLLKLLADLQSLWEWELAIAHCDHGWSTDAGIADHVGKIAQDFEIPFYLKTATNLKETEAAAREWRYQVLTEIAQAYQFNYIVTGHTKSDRAETFLYNLIRGSGSDGLQALGWQRFLTADIQLIRPLLAFSRTETWEFCQQFNLPIWEDEANQKLHYTRNRIRGELIPYLKTNFNPKIENHLTQTADILEAEVEYLETLSKSILQQVLQVDPLGLNRQLLKGIHLALQRRVMRQFLRKVLEKDANFEQIEALISLIDAPNKTRTSSLFKNISLEVQDDWIIIL